MSFPMATRHPRGISRSIIVDHDKSIVTEATFPRSLEILLDQALMVLHLN